MMKDDAFLAFATEFGLTMDEAMAWLAARPEGFDMGSVSAEVIFRVVTRALPEARKRRAENIKALPEGS